jgi:hypothetical protein
MLLFVLVSMALAKTDVKDFILDANLELKPDEGRFVVRNIADYKVKDENARVESADGKTLYVYSSTRDRQAMYRRVKNEDGTSQVNRYRIQDGLVASITTCNTVIIPGFVSNSEDYRCIYMDDEYCRMINKKTMEAIVKSPKVESDGLVRINEVLVNGDPLKGANHRDRHEAKSRTSMAGVNEMFSTVATNIFRTGVPANEVASTFKNIQEMCNQLEGNTASPSTSTASPAAL